MSVFFKWCFVWKCHKKQNKQYQNFNKIQSVSDSQNEYTRKINKWKKNRQNNYTHLQLWNNQLLLILPIKILSTEKDANKITDPLQQLNFKRPKLLYENIVQSQYHACTKETSLLNGCTGFWKSPIKEHLSNSNLVALRSCFRY